jgi:hypothetical protein
MLSDHSIYAKIFGERNTGTNYVEELLKRNFAVYCLKSNGNVYKYIELAGKRLQPGLRGQFRSAVVDLDCARTIGSDFGWKHGVPPFDAISSAPHAKYTLFICVAKHPLSWLRSLAGRPYNPVERAPENFSEFIRHDWALTSRDNLPDHGRINVVDLWNVKNAAFATLAARTERCVLVAYEQILLAPSGFFDSVGRHLIARRRDIEWSLPSTKGDDMSFESYRAKYRMDGIAVDIPEDDLAFIKKRIDPELMKAFGYRWDERAEAAENRASAGT